MNPFHRLRMSVAFRKTYPGDPATANNMQCLWTVETDPGPKDTYRGCDAAHI